MFSVHSYHSHDSELLRSELFSLEQLKRHAITLAEQHRIDSRRSIDGLLPRLDDNERVLLNAYDVVSKSTSQGLHVIPAEAWLLDNFYLIEQQIAQARLHLPVGYSRQLPRLLDGHSAGLPRIYDLALALISHMDGRVDKENTHQFIASYQTVEPLKLGELWAFPIMLQLALLENIRRIAVRIAKRREEHNIAIDWADRMLLTAEQSPNMLIQRLAEFANADVPLTAPFVEEFYARLQAHGSMAFVQTWVEQKLAEQGVSASQLSEVAARVAATHQISIANSIGSLRFIDMMDWREYVESLSLVEQVLRNDPTEAYSQQDFSTRDRYRHVIEDLARGSKISELAVARAALGMAQSVASINNRKAHIGYYLIDAGRSQLELSIGCCVSGRMRIRRIFKRHCVLIYLTPILFGTLSAGALIVDYPWLLPFILLAASALSVSLVNIAVTRLIAPRSLPRLDFSKSIPDAHRTMVVVPTLLSSTTELDALLEALEIRYLGNRDPNLFFALLTDFRDAPSATQDNDAALLQYAHKAVQQLNQTYRDDRPSIFYWFHRPRVWNEHEKVWMAYERKRGKLEQFNALLRGIEQDSFTESEGDLSRLASIKYIITLDTDTQLPRDAAHRLVGNLAHPLNRPVYDTAKGRVVDGYAILQPRASISLGSASRTRFSLLFSGESGIDPYTREVSDVYQDLFAEGSFIGKGIYDVDAFRLALEGRFPDNLILSHDLVESGYARSALVSDVDLIEEHPDSYAVDVSRRHRWIRGDWQLLGWLLPRVPGNQVNPLSALSRWKIFDNLRRSLISPALLILLLSSWWLGAAWLTGAVLLVLFLPVLLSGSIELLHKPKQRDWRVHIMQTSQATLNPLTHATLTLSMLPYDTLISLNAIAQSAGRMLFTRKGLLLWHLSSYTQRNACQTARCFIQEMWIAPLLAASLVAILVVTQQALYYFPVLILWFISPVIAWWISQPLRTNAPDLSAKQRLFLRSTARRTWRFFADLVSEQDNWLPPDNIQTQPQAVIASRTSPTNIGMALLANLSAHDFAYITIDELLTNLDQTLSSMEKLERYHGHFYNWYDTRSLETLRPYYVSSVDSGNLAGCLLTLQAGLTELKNQPVIVPTLFQGLEDTLQVLIEHLPTQAAPELAEKIYALQAKLVTTQQSFPASLPIISSTLNEIRDLYNGILNRLPENIDIDGELHYWTQALEQQIRLWCDKLDALTIHSNSNPSLIDLATVPYAANRLNTINDLVQRCRLLSIMDFTYLYDNSSCLLSIGYDVGEKRRDPSCYDLLASEARLASFLIIAQQQVPQKHWFALGRLLTSHGGKVGLISWSGSMFEYLMPQLIMPNFDNTLLAQTCKTAVARQIEYGKQRGVPWGISESCYNATDMQHTYQYRAFGVPGFGLKRGLADDLVIAPYASTLALMVMPQEACRNLQAMSEFGFLGVYGFYEAIDYTASRVPRGKQHAIVHTFMAHHQGMSLLALAHVLLEQPMQRRFMSDPLVKATALLLQERIPKNSATLHPHAAEASAVVSPAADLGSTMRVFTDPNTPAPEVHLLSNGNYHVMANHSGGGYSRWRDLAVTRWREDTANDGWGTFIYLRDEENGKYWSSAYQPTLSQPKHGYEAIFVQARAEYRRRDHAIETHTEITVSAEDDVEIRRITLSNHSSRARHIEITSFAEVVLAPLNADLAHRAFSNLFVQTEILPDRQAILCTRRPRTAGEAVPWMFHLFATPGVNASEPSFETDRAQFIGRGCTVANPQALTQTTAPLSNSQGAVLDPIVAIRRTIHLIGDEAATVHIISGVAETREAALALLDKYCDRHFIERAFEMAWFHSQEVLRHINVTEADAQVYGSLASALIYANPAYRAAPGIISRNQLGQAGLWRFGVSGDLPIVLLRIGDLSRIEIVKQLLQAHAYWRIKGLKVELVIINDDFSGYRAALQDQILGLIHTGADVQMMDKPGGVFVRRAEDISEDERVLFQTVARAVFSDSTETLFEQVEHRVLHGRSVARLATVPFALPDVAIPLPPLERIFDNGLGGFTPDGHEYIITLAPGQHTPAPWVNVIASPHIGTVVSESGSAYTWVGNAHEFRLTPWHNDPISDTSGEALYIRDEDNGAFWSPTPLPAVGNSAYVCRHGFGYSVFEHNEGGIHSELFTYVAMDAPVKFMVIKLRNNSGRTRQLSLTGYWEWVLGEWRHSNHMHIVTSIDSHSGALFARNDYGRECAKRIAFVQISEVQRSVSASRSEFIGRNGSLSNPAALQRKRLSGKTGAGLDPCAAMQTSFELANGQEREIVFILGAARDKDDARQLIQRFSGPAGARGALEDVWQFWNHTLGTVHVETPDPALNILTNGWLIYQTLSCRYWGRSGYYQSGGAYGFRDQLQDTMALIHATPWLAREQLIRCAERQFSLGDVQHWWHPPSGQGVRTHFSDDYLWLPYATCRYIEATGDMTILDEWIHFLEGRELNSSEEAYYDLPRRSHESASFYEHCVRALKHGLRFGEHHLPLIGCGDWNDGMNLIGAEGKGESVWLAWFLYDNLKQFAQLAQRRNDLDMVTLCNEQATRLQSNIEAQAWDGEWYRRAYFDDGTPLGSNSNQECKIDSISQSWAIISGGGNPARARQAMHAVDQRLVRRDSQIIQLLDPPFDKSALEPGYIRGYLPGVRENGGQYTHAAIWASTAFALSGDTERAWELYSMLNPINRGEQRDRYKVEPYVMSADIYAIAPHTGRGGWTWYTGAAGWMYRLTLETLLGLQLKGDQLHLNPRVPKHWPSYKIHYRFKDTGYHISFVRGEGEAMRVTLDGVVLEVLGVVPLVNDGGQHEVGLELG